MVIYMKVIATIALIMGGFGFVIPTLVSAANTVMVLLGLGALVLMPAIFYYIWEDELGKATSKISKTDDETI